MTIKISITPFADCTLHVKKMLESN